MSVTVFSDKTIEAINFLAKKQHMSVELFIEAVLDEKRKIEEEEKMLENLQKEIEALPDASRLQLLQKLTKLKAETEFQKHARSFSMQRTSLAELKGFHQDELKGIKPTALIINGQRTPVKDWTEATEVFVKLLLANGDLSCKNLPLIVSERGSKAYINSTDTQLDGKDALFKKIGEGIYVDTKYNALGHVKNMSNALKILAVGGKYTIEVDF